MNLSSLSLFSNLFFIRFIGCLEVEEIIGGENAPLGKYPYHVVIEVFGSFVCGGAIIDDYFVITAAHCVTDAKGKLSRFPTRVVGGLNDLEGSSSGRVETNVEKIFIPKEFTGENYSVHLTYDIAVLKVQKRLSIFTSAYLAHVQLPLRSSYENRQAVVTGFGWNWVSLIVDNKTGIPREKGGTYHKLRYAQTRVIGNEECQSMYTKKITDSHLCARVLQEEGNEGVCSGDSGGPLVFGDMLIGIVSSSPLGCAEQLRPAIYTRVTSYLGFINSVLWGIGSDIDILEVSPLIVNYTVNNYQ